MISNQLPQHLLSLYENSLKVSVDNFKHQDNSHQREKVYQYYCTKSLNELNSINTLQLNNECYAIESQIHAKVKQLNQLKQKLIDNTLNTKALGIIQLESIGQSSPFQGNIGSNSNSKSFSEKYSKDLQKLTTQLNELMSKIDSLNNSPFDSMKKAKNEFDNKSEFILQPLINSMIEKRKFYNLVIKERDSKMKIVEEKKTTLLENKMKIERLTKEFNENSERMTNELKQNNTIQKEIEQLSPMNVSQQGSTLHKIPEEQLNALANVNKRFQCSMMNVSDQFANISYYQKMTTQIIHQFVFYIIMIKMNLLSKKKKAIQKNQYEQNLLQLRADNERLINDHSQLVSAALDHQKHEENVYKTLQTLQERIQKYESIKVLLQ